MLREHARLPADVDTRSDDTDLFASGVTSHANVNLMLALEDAFDVELLDRMLMCGVFKSRPLPSQIAAGRTIIVELDSWYLPDAAATGYRSEGWTRATGALAEVVG